MLPKQTRLSRRTPAASFWRQRGVQPLALVHQRRSVDRATKPGSAQGGFFVVPRWEIAGDYDEIDIRSSGGEPDQLAPLS